MRIALAQIQSGAEPTANLGLVEDYTQRAADAGASLVLFPEATMCRFGVPLAPLADAPVAPSVVLFTCKSSAAMLLNEASIRAGAASSLPLLGRPSCMALPAALAHGTVTSLGCIGNRVYTNLGADEMYVVVQGAKLESVSDQLGVIASANTTLEDFARGKQAALSTV